MKKGSIIAIIAILLFALILLIIGRYEEKLDIAENVEEHEFYQYFGGKKYNYKVGITLSRENDITKVSLGDVNLKLDSTPMYYDDIENKVLFPETMSIIFPNQNGVIYKISRFSNIFYNTETAYLENRKEDIPLHHAFLYDGQDLYFFLEKVTLKYGEETVELSPLSYVICEQDILEIYKKAEDEAITIEKGSEKVNAYTDDYNINLNTDSIQSGEKEQLLIKNKNALKNFVETN